MSNHKLVPYTNTGSTPVSICGRVVNPNETRDVDARFVPAPVAVNSSLELLYLNLGDAPKFFGETEVVPGGYARLPANFFVDPNTSADQVQLEMFQALLALPIKKISPYFAAFEDDELKQLISMEQKEGDGGRSTLIEAIEDELAVRVAERDFSPELYAEHLTTLSDDDLKLELLAANDDEQKLALVQSELSDRKDSAGE